MSRHRLIILNSTLVIALMLLPGCQTHQAAQITSLQNTGEVKTESKSQPKPSSAEELGWELIFHDTFDREELGDKWKVVNGKWEIIDGQLHGNGGLVSAQGYPAKGPSGYQRLEFEAISNVRGLDLFPGDKPKVVISNMDGFIHAQSLEVAGKNTMYSGYFFQFGAIHNTLNRISQRRDILWEDKDPKTTLVSEKWHRVVMENDKGTLRFYVNDKLLHEQKLTAIIMGDSQNHVGMFFYTEAKIRDVKVYVKRLPNDLDVE